MSSSVEVMRYDGRVFEVDADIASIVRALNEFGIRTRASCSGHGFRPGRISLADGRELFVMPSYEVATWFDMQFPRDINGQEFRDVGSRVSAETTTLECDDSRNSYATTEPERESTACTSGPEETSSQGSHDKSEPA